MYLIGREGRSERTGAYRQTNSERLVFFFRVAHLTNSISVLAYKILVQKVGRFTIRM